MHCELMLAGLLASDARLPSLELLLARGRLTRGDPQGAAAWLGRACGLEELPAGALTAGQPGFWVRADPVHYRLLRDRVAIAPAAPLDARTADALVATLNRHFAGAPAFRAVSPEAWVMSGAPAPLDAPSTAEVLGRDFAEVLPGGPWPTLLNEIQMALHEHPSQDGSPAGVNGVWLWGPGALPDRVSPPWRSLVADDPLALGLARAGAIEHGTLPHGAADWLRALPGEGRHAALLGGLAPSMEADWFAPLLEALRRDRIGMLTLRVPEAGLTAEASRLDLRRFWRRPRPLEAHAHR
jgi:hypothetical protein